MNSYDIRPYHPDDEAVVLDLMGRSLGWRAEDPNAELFRWKHRDNPFGPSPAWVAVQGEQVIGFRTFMRWEFQDEGRIVRAVRAVDTATHPDHQGRGIFKALTLQALDELRQEGVAFVFNTPNDQSRPGYLKMGWQVVGRLPVRFRPRSLVSLARMAKARVPADLMSIPTPAGVAAYSGAALVDQPTDGQGINGTRRTPAYRRWRYGLPSLHYRVLESTVDSHSAVVFRVRQRGSNIEVVISDQVGAEHSKGSIRMGSLLRATKADYAVAIGALRGSLPAPGVGPLLTWLPLNAAPDAMRRFRWSLGDIELF